MLSTPFDPNIFKPSVRTLWAKINETEINRQNPIKWITSDDASDYEEIEIDRIDIIERREYPQRDAFSKLLANPEFIEEVKETDKMFETDPSKFTNLSELYRKIKKSK